MSLAVGAILCSLLSGPGAAYERPGRNVQVDDPGKVIVDGYSFYSAMSSDGSIIAFDTDVAIFDGDTNLMSDVYVRDLMTQEIWLASKLDSGMAPAPFLVPPTFNYNYCFGQGYKEMEGWWGSGPVAGNPVSWGPSISGNGRFVAFTSWAANLVPGDTNLGPDVFLFDHKKGTMERISVTSDEEEAKQEDLVKSATCPVGSWHPSIDLKGRRVAFASSATNLDPKDDNLTADIYVRDLRTDRTKRVSVPLGPKAECLAEVPAPEPVGTVGILCPTGKASVRPSISGDGRFVVFQSDAEDLVEGDTNAVADVFLRDLAKKKTERISVDSSEEQIADDRPYIPFVDNSEIVRTMTGLAFWEGLPHHAISADGRYVVFLSRAPDVVPQHAGGNNVYVRDRKEGRTVKINVVSQGDLSLDLSSNTQAPSISRTGRFIHFNAGANNYDGGGWSGFVHDLATGAVDSVSHGSGGKPGSGGCEPSLTPYYTWYLVPGDINYDGRYVSYATCYDNLLDETKSPSHEHLIRHDRGELVGTIGFGGAPSNVPPEDDRLCILPDVCIPPLTPLVGEDRTADHPVIPSRTGSDLDSMSVSYRPDLGDLFVAIEVEDMPRVDPGSSTILYSFGFTTDRTRYEVRASSAMGGTFGLFDCSSSIVCGKVAEIRGGFGTTGMRVVFSLPLTAVGLEHGGEIRDVIGESGLGDFHGGIFRVLDSVRLVKS